MPAIEYARERVALVLVLERRGARHEFLRALLEFLDVFERLYGAQRQHLARFVESRCRDIGMQQRRVEQPLDLRNLRDDRGHRLAERGGVDSQPGLGVRRETRQTLAFVLCEQQFDALAAERNTARRDPAGRPLLSGGRRVTGLDDRAQRVRQFPQAHEPGTESRVVRTQARDLVRNPLFVQCMRG